MKIGATTINNCKIGSVQVNEVRIGGTLVWSSAPAYDADAQLFIKNYSITDNIQKTAINNAVISLKAGTLWGKGSVILPYVGGNATAHSGNLKTAMNGVTWNGGITHNSNGVTFNGTNGYGNVNFTASGVNVFNRTHAQSFKISPTQGSGWSGIFQGGNVFGMQFSETPSPTLQALGVNNLTANSSAISYGVIVNSILSNINGRIYKNNKSNIYTNSSLGSSPTSGNMYTGALNNSGTAAFFNPRTTDFEYYGAGLSSIEVGELIDIINAFNTTLGR